MEQSFHCLTGSEAMATKEGANFKQRQVGVKLAGEALEVFLEAFVELSQKAAKKTESFVESAAKLRTMKNKLNKSAPFFTQHAGKQTTTKLSTHRNFLSQNFSFHSLHHNL